MKSSGQQPCQPRRGFALPVEWLIALRVCAGWTHERAAGKAEVSVREWVRWELGEHRVQAASWHLMLRRAGLPETWRPPTALVAWASTVVGHKHDVVAMARALGATAPGESAIERWRREQAPAKAPVPVERVVLRPGATTPLRR